MTQELLSENSNAQTDTPGKREVKSPEQFMPMLTAIRNEILKMQLETDRPKLMKVFKALNWGLNILCQRIRNGYYD